MDVCLSIRGFQRKNPSDLSDSLMFHIVILKSNPLVYDQDRRGSKEEDVRFLANQLPSTNPGMYYQRKVSRGQTGWEAH